MYYLDHLNVDRFLYTEIEKLKTILFENPNNNYTISLDDVIELEESVKLLETTLPTFQSKRNFKIVYSNDLNDPYCLEKCDFLYSEDEPEDLIFREYDLFEKVYLFLKKFFDIYDFPSIYNMYISLKAEKEFLFYERDLTEAVENRYKNLLNFLSLKDDLSLKASKLINKELIFLPSKFNLMMELLDEKELERFFATEDFDDNFHMSSHEFWDYEESSESSESNVLTFEELEEVELLLDITYYEEKRDKIEFFKKLYRLSDMGKPFISLYGNFFIVPPATE